MQAKSKYKNVKELIQLEITANQYLSCTAQALKTGNCSGIVSNIYSCCKSILTNPDGHFLVVKPVYHPGWDIPSGHVDKNESPDAAAVRELFEETGIKISTLEQRSVIFQPLCNTIQVIFSGTVDPTPSVKPDNVEISEARWVKRGEVNLLPHAMEALDVLLDKRIAYHVSMINP